MANRKKGRSRRKKTRRSGLIALWTGKIAEIIDQSSDAEVRTLARLLLHEKLGDRARLLIFESAILDVWSRRMADREAEARDRRRTRRQHHTEGRP